MYTDAQLNKLCRIMIPERINTDQRQTDETQYDPHDVAISQTEWEDILERENQKERTKKRERTRPNE